MNAEPTAQLRFVHREVRTELSPTVATVRTLTILQQWWEYTGDWVSKSGEWRDVPVEKET